MKLSNSYKAIALGGIMALMAGCTLNDSGVSRKKYNNLVDKYNSLVEQSTASNEDIHSTNQLIQQLDVAALKVRKKSREIQLNITSYANANQFSEDMKRLDEYVTSALMIVGRLETQSSTKNVDAMIQVSDIAIKEEFREDYQKTAKSTSDKLSTLSGIRDLIIGQYNSVMQLATLHFDELPSGVTQRDINPHNEVQYVSEDVNPVVSGFSEGGRVRGIARDSVSGNAVSNAFVGFKRRPESTDYFFETTTNSDGAYQSPYLLPGSYYVDIRREGYINMTNQLVSVSRGQESSENLSMSEPVAEGSFRVTLAWTDEKANAVSDVDSYLKIPGVSRPLNYTLVRTDYHGSYLDIDERFWVGPETTTIHEVKQGTYIFYVDNYNNRNNRRALGNSNIRVTLYKGESVYGVYNVPQGEGLTYEVFRIIDGEVKVTGRYDDSLSRN
tara:strand:- start:6213 stop:7538 length:1326 start_codon:yes stop_codon:yes gene_type:complete